MVEVRDFNPVASTYPSETALSDLFEAQVDRTPDAIAVEHRSATMTYRALDEAANRLARRLRREGVVAGSRVALFLERSPEMIVSMLAALKAGAAYVPLDPSYPSERLALMLGDAEPRVVIGTTRLLAQLPPDAASRVDLADESIHVESTARLPCSVGAGDRAYILYTSGSTGRPKGVSVRHRGIARLVLSTNYITLGASDRVAQANSASFDAATFEIWGALLNGACLVIVDRDVVIDPAVFGPEIARLRLTTLLLTTAIFNQLVDTSPETFRGLENLLFGGEAVNVRTVRKVLPHKPARLVHVYGPTEATTFATTFLIEAVPADATTISIGLPIANTTAYVLDEKMQPVEAGVPGELYIGGDGNAEGYWKLPELTAERFVLDPFMDRPGATLYRSGDLVRRRPDGNIEFIERIDKQVKVGGYRIELGEIEAKLADCAGVRSAIVTARDDGGGGKRLVAYLVAESGVSLEPAALKSALAAQLPPYMVPGAFVTVAAIPLTPNGKVDQSALPTPDESAFAASAYVAPRTATEQAVAKLFGEVLRVPRVGLHDDFFALGGHSLHAMQLATRLKRDLNAVVPVRVLFEERTVEALARHVESAASSAEKPDAPLVKVAKANNRVPLSRLQERLWFLTKLEPTSSAYSVSTATRLSGDLRADVLERACAELVKRHESLRTTFEEKGDQVVQVVHDALPLRWERRDLSRVPAQDRERTALEQARREATTPFDLRRGPLFRVKLLKLADEEHVLLFTMHHIVSDGWSLGVLAGELESLYAAFLDEQPSSLPELAVHYGDYAVWERQTVTDAAIASQVEYWKAHLSGAPAALELPTDRPRSPSQGHRGAHVTGRISRQTSDRLLLVARRHRASAYMTLLTAFSALLSRLSGQDEVVIATPVVNRARPETEGMIGFFMNTLALRIDASGHPTFDELLVRAREASMGAFAHQDVPFERVVQELNPVRDMSRNPLAQVSLNVLNLPDWHIRLRGVEARPMLGAAAGSKFDLTLYVEQRDGLELEVVYDADLFDEARMVRFIRRFEAVVEHLAAKPETRIDEVSLVLQDEQGVLPDPRAPLERGAERSIAASFDAHAHAAPDRPAVRDARGEWSYAELQRRSNQVANWLGARGIGAGDVVAIHAERNALTIWALLSVVKSGAAFVLLASDYPAARLVDQVRLAKPSAWINASEAAVSAELAAAMPARDKVIDLVGATGAWTSEPSTAPKVDVGLDERAYIAFTSGTTGGPRAIAGSHAPLAHFVEWHAKTHALGADDRFSALSGIAHDPFLRDVFTPLAVGGCACVPPSDILLEPDALAGWMAEQGITVAHLTPSLGEVLALARGALPSLRLACFAGETLRGELVQSLRPLAPAARFVNFYGATETPQAMGHQLVAEGASGVIPVGRGIDGVQLLVVGESGALSAVDEEGEIWVRTPYLAMGYVDGDPRGFGANPFTGNAEDRVYRTGDRGRLLPDGTVQAIGRVDDQVKVRGFRVELAEVVGAIRAHDGARQAAVILDERGRGLIAYVVGTFDVDALMHELRERLPSYMVPSSIVKLDAIPLTPNGKVDRRALPAPEVRSTTTQKDDGDEVTSRIIEIWKDVLDVESIDTHANFFDHGGHSLLATQLAVRLREAFGVEIPVRTIFEAPTIAKLARRVAALLLEAGSRPGGG